MKYFALLLISFLIYLNIDVRLTSDFAYFYISALNPEFVHKGFLVSFLYKPISTVYYFHQVFITNILIMNAFVFIAHNYLRFNQYIILIFYFSLFPLYLVPNTEIISTLLFALVIYFSLINKNKNIILLIFLVCLVALSRTHTLILLLMLSVYIAVMRKNYNLITACIVAIIFFMPINKNIYYSPNFSYGNSVLYFGVGYKNIDNCGAWNEDSFIKFMKNDPGLVEIIKEPIRRNAFDNLSFYICKTNKLLFLPLANREYWGYESVLNEPFTKVATGIDFSNYSEDINIIGNGEYKDFLSIIALLSSYLLKVAFLILLIRGNKLEPALIFLLLFIPHVLLFEMQSRYMIFLYLAFTTFYYEKKFNRNNSLSSL